MLQIETKTFFILVATLAAGGGAGYLASEKHILPPLEPPKPEPPKPEPPKPVATASVTASAPPIATTPAPPPCDDMTALVGDCPPPGLPTIEGGCGSFAAIRCGEFKQAMKPRVAASAVTCLQKLNAQERCDPKRVNLCGHMALMNACAEPEMSFDNKAAPPVGVTAICQGIVASCTAAPVVPSLVDCERTLAGMTAVGRERMVPCLKKHCFDKGLLHCEAVADPN